MSRGQSRAGFFGTPSGSWPSGEWQAFPAAAGARPPARCRWDGEGGDLQREGGDGGLGGGGGWLVGLGGGVGEPWPPGLQVQGLGAARGALSAVPLDEALARGHEARLGRGGGPEEALEVLSGQSGGWIGGGGGLGGGSFVCLVGGWVGWACGGGKHGG